MTPSRDLSRSLVSVLIPALNEVLGVPGLLARYRELARTHDRYDFEMVLVDDGSDDGTADRLLELAEAPDRVTVVSLSRNFGSHYAITAGLARCSGDCAVVLGADLPEPPSLMQQFLTHWETGSDVVWGVRRSRVRRSWSYDVASRLFSWLFARYAKLSNYPPEGPSGVLLDRAVIDEVRRLPEHNRNVLALIAWLGFTQTRVQYDQVDRRHGTSRWTRRSIVTLAVDSMLQFSSMPLRLCTFGGVVVAALGLLYALVLVVRSMAGVGTPSGWPTVIVVVLLLGGTQLTVIGVMGEYLWRAVEESRGRPLYVVRDVRLAGVHPQRPPDAPRHGRRSPVTPASPPRIVRSADGEHQPAGEREI
jgi:polyisoprenyl-phosphate glycosyltransferase